MQRLELVKIKSDSVFIKHAGAILLAGVLIYFILGVLAPELGR